MFVAVYRTGSKAGQDMGIRQSGQHVGLVSNGNSKYEGLLKNAWFFFL